MNDERNKKAARGFPVGSMQLLAKIDHQNREENEMRYLTIVYAINDEDAFKEETKRIQSLFDSPEDQPWTISAFSRQNEMSRVELIESALNEGCGLEVIDAIVNAPDLVGKDLNFFR